MQGPRLSPRRYADRVEERAALATVVATRRSAPRPVGSKLVVFESGRLHGSVSGGCVESDVAEQAKEVIAGGEPRLLTYGIADDQAWGIGLPCGGEIDVFIQRLEGELPQDGDDARLTVLEGPRAGQQWLADVEGPSRVLELDGEKVFAEVPAVRLLPRREGFGLAHRRGGPAARARHARAAAEPGRARDRLAGRRPREA
ncbi:MAG: hypothetical protein DMF84_31375 [Acidobacteria bacterium]|nr:MAG: hypothetical protein DMF84_31375 [Acidobacteriota bacterium]